MNRIVKLPVGLSYDGYVKEVEILRSNGIAERIFIDKLPEKPYTWMGNIISASIKEIGGITIAEKCREEYLKTRSITIPHPVLKIPLADVHTLLLEIHRKAWKSVIKKQEAICKYCGTKMITDVDLKLIDFKEPVEDKEWKNLVCNLEEGFEFTAFGKKGSDTRMYEEYDGIVFNQMVFRIPTLSDGIANEYYADDNVSFWRRIAFDTLESFNAVTDGEVTHTLPKEAFIAIGMKMFDQYLYSEDLRSIRETLRETLPVLPYYYLAECVNPSCKRMTPISMEAGNFFSD